MGRSVCGRMFDGVCLFLPFVRGFLPKLAIKSILHIHGSASLWPFVYDFIHPSPLQSSSMSSSFPSRPLWCAWPCLVGAIDRFTRSDSEICNTKPTYPEPKQNTNKTRQHPRTGTRRCRPRAASPPAGPPAAARPLARAACRTRGAWGVLWGGGGERDGWWTGGRRLV